MVKRFGNKMSLSIFLNNLSEIVTGLTTIFVSIMSVFMQPPLIIYIGIALFLVIITSVHYLLILSRSKQYIKKASILKLESEQKYGKWK